MTSLRSIVLGVAVLSLVGSGAGLKAKDRVPESVTLSFGAGLNTPAATNHHILPQMVTVRMTPGTATASGNPIPAVVNFVVGGFHQIFIFKPGTTPADVDKFIADNNRGAATFINDRDNNLYTGINPLRNSTGAAGEIFFPTVNSVTPPTAARGVVNGNDNGTNNNLADDIPPGNQLRVGFQNRAESVGFDTPGTYLVICNVRGHFQDGMTAWINVVVDEEDDDADDHDDDSGHSGHGGN